MLNNPPKAGPMMKPAPFAAPTFPIPLVRSCSSVMSAMYAWATPASVAIPAAILDNKRKAKESANAKMIKLTAEDKIDNKITGLRPTLSDNRPRMGENMNCIKEKEPTSIPRARAPASTVCG